MQQFNRGIRTFQQENFLLMITIRFTAFSLLSSILLLLIFSVILKMHDDPCQPPHFLQISLFSAKSPLMHKTAITWSYFSTYFNSETWVVGVTKNVCFAFNSNSRQSDSVEICELLSIHSVVQLRKLFWSQTPWITKNEYYRNNCLYSVIS